MTWKLEQHDTFSHEHYPLAPGYETREEAEGAAERLLDEIERLQPSAQSGGQGPAGIQDRVYVLGPDGSRTRYVEPSVALGRHLRMLRSARRGMLPLPPGYNYFGAEDYVLAKGRAYASQPLKDDERAIVRSALAIVPDALPRECYANAMRLVLEGDRERLVYVEGYVARDEIPIPISHAWVTINGKVIDPTPVGAERVLGEFVAREYYGASFTVAELEDRVERSGEWGTLLDWFEADYPAFRKPR